MKHPHCELIHAWADGAEIEYFRRYINGEYEWVLVSYTTWDKDTIYRIKGGQTPIIARNSELTSGTLVAPTTTIPVIDPILNLEDIKWV